MSARGMGGFARWRFAARLARREVRRRPGRSALVVALVAVPVLAMTAGDVLYRTQDDPWPEEYARRFGRSDLAVQFADQGATPATSGGLGRGAIKQSLHAGARTVEYHTIIRAPIRSAAGPLLDADFTDLPVADPITDGIIDVSSGRAPTNDDDVLLSPDVARKLQVEVDDELVLDRPDRTYRVVGIGRRSDDLKSSLVVVGAYPFGDLNPSELQTTLLVDQLGSTAPRLPGSLRPDGSGDGFTIAYSPTIDPSATDGEQGDGPVLAWGWVAGSLMLTALGIIIAAAFATSARRQLLTLGQLSANGADESLLRRTLALQGAWSGFAGATVGIAGALVALAAAKGRIEVVIGQRLGPWTIRPLELVIILATGTLAATIAAYLPARTISRVPVLKALAGRRPLGGVPRWLVPVGLGLFGLGTLLLLLVALSSRTGGGNLLAAVAVLGGLGVLAGACCVSPALVGVLGPIASRTTGTTKLAARGLARARTRSAAVVTAIAVAGAIAVVIGTALATDGASGNDEPPQLPSNMVEVVNYPPAAPGASPTPGVVDAAPATLAPVPATDRERLLGIVPGMTFVPLRYATYDPPPGPQQGAVMGDLLGDRVLVADDAVVDLIGLTAHDRRTLRQVDVLIPSGWLPGADGMDPAIDPPSDDDEPTTVTVTIPTASGPVDLQVSAANDDVDAGALVRDGLITPAAARRAGAVIGESGLVGIAPRALTADQRSRLSDLRITSQTGYDPFVAAGKVPVEVGQGSNLALEWEDPPRIEVSQTQLQLLVVGFALLLTLAVVVIGLALAAAEGRDERDVLVAVGAKPSSMRRFAGAKAWWLTVLGGVLAVPLGYVPITVVLSSFEDHDPVRFPWLVAGALVVVTPLVAAAMAWAGSSVTQRFRPVTMSTFATD